MLFTKNIAYDMIHEMISSKNEQRERFIHMKLKKSLLCGLLSLGMVATLLTGCGKKDECRACAAMVYTETGTYDKVPQYRCEMTKNYPEACKKVLKELEQQL